MGNGNGSGKGKGEQSACCSGPLGFGFQELIYKWRIERMRGNNNVERCGSRGGAGLGGELDETTRLGFIILLGKNHVT